MPRRRIRERLVDILEAIGKVEGYIAGMDRTAFVNDPRTIDAVLHNIQIIGEATSALEPAVTAKYPKSRGSASSPCVIGWCMDISALASASSGIPYRWTWVRSALWSRRSWLNCLQRSGPQP
jgi:hypothetical protein